MTIDLEAVHGLAPVIGSLPGDAVPYYLQSGDGLRFERDNQLWTIVARASDTGSAFDAAFVLGGRGAAEPFHSLAEHQRSYVVFDGSVQFWLPGESRILNSGDSVHIPPGVPVAYRMLAHMSRVLFFSAPGGALDALANSVGAVEQSVYSAGTATGIGGPMLAAGGVDRHDLEYAPIRDVWDSELPAGIEGYFNRAHTGEMRAWPDAVNAYSARGRNTGGRYFGVTSVSGRQPYIPQHFHRLHTENFFCMSGRVWLWLNGQEVLLTPGDFVHAPAGTIHSFAITAPATRMLGLLTTDVFEPFFDRTGIATDDNIYTEGLVDPSTLFQRLGQIGDLDVTMVGPPPRRTFAPGL